MIIGIDAKTLGKRKTGIGFYLQTVLKYISENDKKNLYYLYTNREIAINFKLPSNFIIKKYKAKIASLYIFYRFKKILEKDHVDLFWGPEHILPKKSSKYKMIVTIHDLAFKKIKHICTYNNLIIQNLIAKRSCKNANEIIAISKSTANDITNIYKINSNKIKIIYNGQSPFVYNASVNCNEKKYIFSKFNIKTSKYLLFVGAIEPRKNLTNMILAFDKYCDKYDKDISFVIAGGLGWKYKTILKTIKKSKYKDNIILTDYISQDDKEKLYIYSEALYFVSLYEGLGLPIIEALSLGKNVITSNISSMPEIGGKVCIYVNNPKNVNEITEAINKIKSIDIPVKEKIDQAKKFTISDCCISTLNLFNKLLGRKKDETFDNSYSNL